jgi:hypothetical protein
VGCKKTTKGQYSGRNCYKVRIISLMFSVVKMVCATGFEPVPASSPIEGKY